MFGVCKDNPMIPASGEEPQRKLWIYMEWESHQFVAIGPKIMSYFPDWKIHAVEDNLMDI